MGCFIKRTGTSVRIGTITGMAWTLNMWTFGQCQRHFLWTRDWLCDVLESWWCFIVDLIHAANGQGFPSIGDVLYNDIWWSLGWRRHVFCSFLVFFFGWFWIGQHTFTFFARAIFSTGRAEVIRICLSFGFADHSGFFLCCPTWRQFNVFVVVVHDLGY